jgi:hypothetical protein
MSDDFKASTTPPLEEVMRAAVREALLSLNVCMPGVVESYNSATNTVSVRPALKRLYETDTVPTALPIISMVPVVYPRGGAFKMKWNLLPGDSVTLIFSQRSIDIWKSQGGVVDPDDPRRFHLSDAIAIPGGYPSTNPISDSVVGQTVLESGSLQIILEDSGKIKITNGGAELLSAISSALGAIQSAFTTLSSDKVLDDDGGGPVPLPLVGGSSYGSAASAVGTAKGLIDSLKG